MKRFENGIFSIGRWSTIVELSSYLCTGAIRAFSRPMQISLMRLLKKSLYIYWYSSKDRSRVNYTANRCKFNRFQSTVREYWRKISFKISLLVISIHMWTQIQSLNYLMASKSHFNCPYSPIVSRSVGVPPMWSMVVDVKIIFYCIWCQWICFYYRFSHFF